MWRGIAVPATVQDAYWQCRQAIRSNEPIILLEYELLYFGKGTLEAASIPRSADIVAAAEPLCAN